MKRSRKPNRLLAALKSVGVSRLLLLLTLGIFGAWFSFALAVSGVTRTKNPEIALSLLPHESTALATRADGLFFANPQKPPREIRSLAMAALHQQAINAKALRVLGYFEDSRGNSKKAGMLIRMAAKLSRREPGAQLWLIEASARRNDTRQTLIHYHIGLRTKPEMQTILFPRLLSAIEEPEIRAELKPYIVAKNGWAASFLSYANANSKNLPALVDLVVETGGLPDKKSAKNQELELLSRLVNEKLFGDARRLYLQMTDAKAGRLTSTAFDRADRDNSFGPMGWQIVNGPDAGGGFADKGGEKQISLYSFANSSTTQAVASRLLYLRKGNYDFSAKLASLDRGDGGFLRWQLRCPTDGTSSPLWTFDSIGKTTRATFAIPATCPVQFLDLIVSGGKGQTGLEATVASISVVPQAN